MRAILWLDAVVLMAAGFALGGKPLALGHDADPWTWLALAGSLLTAVLAALAAFNLSTPSANQVWSQLPAPAVVLWMAGSLGGIAMPADAYAMPRPAECLGFLLTAGLPLLAVMLFMLRRAARQAPSRALMMGALASAGAGASLLALVHPHPATVLDLCSHAAALAVLLGIGAAAARFGRRPSA